jgi:hypothetical protein
MANFKVDFLFSQPDRSWHEVYYRTGDSLAAVANIPSVVITTSLAFRSRLTVMRKITVTDTVNTRLSVIKTINRNGTDAPSTGTPDITSTAARIKLSSPSIGSSRSVWARGLVDADVIRNQDSGVDSPSGFLLSAIDNFVYALANNFFVNRGLVPPSTPGYDWKTISTIQKVNDGSIKILFMSAVGQAVGTFIQIAQVDPKDWPALNGRYKLLAVDGSIATIGYNTHRAVGTYDVKKGRGRQSEYRYGFLSSFISGFSGFTSRKTGGSPLVGAGRRSALVRRSA